MRRLDDEISMSANRIVDCAFLNCREGIHAEGNQDLVVANPYFHNVDTPMRFSNYSGSYRIRNMQVSHDRSHFMFH